MDKLPKLKLLSERLKYLIDERLKLTGEKTTGAELGRITKMSRTSVSFWLNDENGISAEASRALGEFFGVNPLWIETGEDKKTAYGEFKSSFSIQGKSREVEIESSEEFIKIKRVDLKLSAGITGYSVEYLNGDRAPIIFRRDWVESKGYNPEHLYALKVSGQSMETSLYDNDLVVINADDTKPLDGEVFAVNYEGELVIKRLIRQAGAWHLSSDNPDKRKYADKVCHENCIIIGRVIYKQSERI